MTPIPPVRRRLLGSALREYREGLGYNLDEAARILECDRSKISRIETGQRGIRAKELRELLTEYGVAAGEQEALLAIAHRGRETGWWLDYRDVLSAEGQDYVIMETAATEILAYEPGRVPDLLQTPQYARALADADLNCTCDEQRAHAVEVTRSRQRIVLGDRDPVLEFIVTEGALRQVVGGPAVMRAQLERLAALSQGRSRVTLRILPFAAGAHAASGPGAMTILRFAQAPGIGIIHLAGLSGGVSLEGRDDLARYRRTFAGLRAAALSPAASAQLLRALAES